MGSIRDKILEGLQINRTRITEGVIPTPRNSGMVTGMNIDSHIQILKEIRTVGTIVPLIGSIWTCVATLPSFKQATFMLMDASTWQPMTKFSFNTELLYFNGYLHEKAIRIMDAGEVVMPPKEKWELVQDTMTNLGFLKSLHLKTLGKVLTRDSIKSTVFIVNLADNDLEDTQKETLLRTLQTALSKRDIKSALDTKQVLKIF